MKCAACGRTIERGAVLVNGTYYCSNSCEKMLSTYESSKGKYDIGTGLNQMLVGSGLATGTANADNLLVGGAKVALGLGGLAVTGLIAGGKLIAKKSREAKQAEEQQAIKEAEQARISKAKFEALKSNRKMQTATVNSNAIEFIFCGDCGVKNESGDMFCSDCGSKLN